MNETLKEQSPGKNVAPFVLSLPNDKIKHFPILNSTQSLRMKSALITLQPGENVGSHNTGKHEELLVILDGIGEVQAEGLGRQKIVKESVVYITAGNEHNVTNVGSAPLRYIYIVSQID